MSPTAGRHPRHAGRCGADREGPEMVVPEHHKLMDTSCNSVHMGIIGTAASIQEVAQWLVDDGKAQEARHRLSHRPEQRAVWQGAADGVWVHQAQAAVNIGVEHGSKQKAMVLVITARGRARSVHGMLGTDSWDSNLEGSASRLQTAWGQRSMWPENTAGGIILKHGAGAQVAVAGALPGCSSRSEKARSIHGQNWSIWAQFAPVTQHMCKCCAQISLLRYKLC